MTASNSLTVLESSMLVAPITALEFLGDDYLLAGEGPNLSVYCLGASPRQYASLSVLQNYRIHGIRPSLQNKNEHHVTLPEVVKLAVFGGKAVQLVNIRPRSLGLEVAGVLMELQDWVLDVSWLQGETSSLLGVCLAHNALLFLEPESGNVLALRSCVEVCLLYSALLIGPSWETSVLVGGTVFNQLILWRPGGTRADGQSQVERRLLGHSGVIFSVCYLQSSGWLTSASDDRSIRVWHVGKLGADGGCGEESPTCLRVLYGHQARVFCVRLTSGCVFSAGEDGACLLWEWKGEGKVGRTLKGHRSGGIRSLAVSKEGGWVATGGADGGIRLWRLSERSEQEKENKEGDRQTDLEFSGQGCPKVVRSVGGHGDILVCTDEGEVFLYHNASWDLVWNGGLDFQSYCVMEVVCMKSQDSCKVIWLCAVGNLTGGIYVFPVCQPRLGIFLQAGEGKVHTLQWVQGSHLCLLASGAYGVVYRWTAKMIENKSGQVLRLEKLKPFVLPPCAKRWLTAAVTFPCGKESVWVCGDRRGSLLLYKEKEIGGEGQEERKNKEGAWKDEKMDGMSLLPPVSVLFGVHGKQGVTSVSEHHGVCYTSGRDGCVRVFTVNDDSLNIRRIHRASKGMEWLDNVILIGSDIPENQRSKDQDDEEDKEEDRIPQQELDNRLVGQEETEEKRMAERESESVSEVRFVMVAFRSVHFILWDQLKRETLFSATCGGGHRSWAYIFPTQTPLSTHTMGQGTLIFIKQGSVVMSRSLNSTSTEVTGHTLKEGLHGRGLSSVCHLGSISKGEASSKPWEVLVTGGEDTTVTVLAVEPEHGTVKVLAIIADHISNVRALAAVRKVTRQEGSADRRAHIPFSTMLFSAGGRAQLQCYRLLIDWDEQGNGPVCQVSQVAGHRLDEQWEKKRNRHKTVKMDPETRYMSIAVVLNTTEEIILALACSDGAVRLFSVREDSRTVELLWESFHHQRCVLSAASCRVADPQGKRVLLFSGATDGAVALWDLTTALDSKSKDSWHGPSAPYLSISVHQSGVNALNILNPHEEGQTAKDTLTVVSGGDDGQLSVLKIRLQFQQENVFPELLSRWSVALAHSAPLTALSALSSSLLVSTSPDQRVCVWSVGDNGIQHQATTFSHTADAAGLWVWRTEGTGTEGGACVAVCGQGLQLLKLIERGTGEGKQRIKIQKERRKVIFADRFITV
ncbi:WD repeat-containing protein 6 [Trichomycterus rosablanca]|uniref:WD repeat-containing protein 6 n=1 Tax=Trichomycterus rosablanca TaxID=2290929 RepID=UPI002F35DE0A